MQKVCLERWIDLWNRAGAKSDPNPVYEDLVRWYAEPTRAYHTLNHIEHCLTELDLVEHLPYDPEAVELALWFHDAAKTESLSADLFSQNLLLAGMRADFVRQVRSMILATSHQAAPLDNDTKLVVDIDLSIFGQSAEVFDRYCAQIREEYRHCSDAEYMMGRSLVLAKFLQRNRIYSIPMFQWRYEDQARANLTRALSLL
jgi:predicted metal-dependent HD superfamily phosphohydrolase